VASELRSDAQGGALCHQGLRLAGHQKLMRPSERAVEGAGGAGDGIAFFHGISRAEGNSKQATKNDGLSYRLFSANFSRNFFNLGATTNEQYPCPGFLTKYS
jgi:hypothetical protein